MRVLIINTSERIGGAAIAASRLTEALKSSGIKAKMLVRDKQTDHISVVALKKSWRKIWQFVWERVIIWKANHFKRENLFAVDIANTGTDVTSLPEFRQADVIHLHWVNQGMLSLKISGKSQNQANPSYGPCTTCGPSPESATMPRRVRGIPNSVIPARCFTKDTEMTSPAGYSTRKKKSTATPT